MIKNKKVRLCLLLLLLLVDRTWAVTFETAMAYYSGEKYEQAHEAFVELASIGNERAQFNLGVMYARGEYVQQDFVESAAWLMLSNDTVTKDSTEKVLTIVSGKLDEAGREQAQTRFQELLASYGHDTVQSRYFPEAALDENGVFQRAKLVVQKVPKFPRLRKVVPGIVDVQYTIAADGSARNIIVLVASNDKFKEAALESVRALQFKPATVNGEPTTEFGRRMRYNFTVGNSKVDLDYLNEFVEPLKQDAIIGGAREKYSYAYTLGMLDSMTGQLKGSEKVSLDPASDWFQKAAQDGSAMAKFELGLDLSYGKQCLADSKKSYFWLEQAADDGVLDAKMFLGLELLNGGHFAKDVSRGMALLEEAAKGNYAHAKLALAWIYATHPDKTVRDVTQASAHLKTFNSDDYLDKLSVYETEAVVYALNGDSKAARKALDKAMAYRHEYELPAGLTADIMAALDAGKVYTSL